MSTPRYSLHAFADDATAVVARLATGRDRFFARGIDSPSLSDSIRATRVSAPTTMEPGIYEASAETPAGTLDPAYGVARWAGPGRPTLIFLQGSGDRPFDDSPKAQNTFKSVVLDASQAWDANLAVVRAPFHAGSQRAYARAMGELVNFTSMLAAMVALTEHLVRTLNAAGGQTVVTGVSLGGWATNLHAALYGSAASYVPVMAGAALDDLFLHSIYRWLTGRPAKAQPDRLRAVLNFEEDFRAAPDERVFPLLARHDRYIRHEPQARSYGGLPVRTMERGHITAVAAPEPIREHLRRHVPVFDAERTES